MEATPKSEKQGCWVKFKRGLVRLKTTIVEGLDNVFEGYGRLVAQYPVRVIAVCVLVTGLCGLGLLRFRQENNWRSGDQERVLMVFRKIPQ